MEQKQCYEAFFENYEQKYESESFVGAKPEAFPGSDRLATHDFELLVVAEK